MFTINIANPQMDYDRLAELLNQADNSNTTPQNMRTWDENNKNDILFRYAACLEDNLIGYGIIFKSHGAKTERFLVWLTIDAAYRNQGYGTQFYDFLYERVQGYNPVDLISDCMDNHEPSLLFAQKRGFEIRRHYFESKIDLTTFNDAEWQFAIDKVAAQGMRFTTLAAEGNTHEAQYKLYELNKKTAEDNPSNDGSHELTFEHFQSRIIGADWFRADGQHLAVDGDRYVGLGAIGFADDTRIAYNAFTGTDAEYRGRGIALALKVIGARYAREKGAEEIVTDNDSENAPMLHINTRLGYVRQPGKYWLINRQP